MEETVHIYTVINNEPVKIGTVNSYFILGELYTYVERNYPKRGVRVTQIIDVETSRDLKSFDAQSFVNLLEVEGRVLLDIKTKEIFNRRPSSSKLSAFPRAPSSSSSSLRSE